ncbi:MAG: CPBP family intramembrane metalloprotease [Chloroflexi bacterium]|nr:CPBP family intramembrane metalloprotease [Chloroflexota bacterium]
MKNQTVQWKNIIIFCILAFALLWVPFFGATWASKGGNDPGAWGILLGIMGPFSPLIAAVITRKLIAREGFGDAHLSLRKIPGRYWLLALALPFFWNSVQDILQLQFGFATMDWSQVPAGLYRIPINLFAGVLIFIGEEFGWRSYLLEKLQPLGRWRALLISGLIWALWHAPAVIIPNTAMGYGEQMSWLGSGLTLLIFVLLGFIFGWMYLESKSVWPGALMHSFNNLIVFGLLSEAWTTVQEPTLLQNALIAIGPILLVWLVLYWRDGFANHDATTQ